MGEISIIYGMIFKMKNLFITGISGCVGHYLFDVLAQNQDYQLFLLVRDVSKLKFNYQAYPNVKIVKGDMRDIDQQSGLLKEMDYVIHAAAHWGGTEINYDYTIALFNLLDEKRCKKVIYLSTASLLGPHNQVLAEADELGTGYIRGKYLTYKKLPELKIYNKITTLFPTWVLGGDKTHPYSHGTLGLLGVPRWLWLLRFFTVDISFHFIHAQDIARIIAYLLENEVKERESVLGNPVITASAFIREICNYYKKRVYFQINLSAAFIKTAAKIFGKELHPWDVYSIDRRHFQYRVVNAASFGLQTDYQTLSGILESLKK